LKLLCGRSLQAEADARDPEQSTEILKQQDLLCRQKPVAVLPGPDTTQTRLNGKVPE
jgi:hypothetical protein